MPSSWSSRFLHASSNNKDGGSSSTSTPSRNPPSRPNPRDKPLPRPPSAAFEEPTLIGRDGERSLPPVPQVQQASPSRPRTTEGRHTHGRSVSHPLPKLFGKKKSTGQLGTSYNDGDLPLDDELVPVLDEGPSGTPTRVISGKKGAKVVDDSDKASRKCMCCDALVKVPRDLDKFRCMSCYTINDLRPVEEQKSDREERERKASSKRGENFPGGMPPGLRTLPLTLERTRAIVDRCIMTYLEVRCRREESACGKKPDSPAQTPDEKENPMEGIAIRPRVPSEAAKQLVDAPVSSSPPDTPEPDEATVTASANITDFRDFDLFAYHRTDTPPPAEKKGAPQGPGPPASVRRKPVPTQPSRKPPPPPLNATNRPAQQRMPSRNGELSPKPQISPKPTPQEIEQRRRYDRVKTIFRPLEDYIADSFGNYRCLSASFSTIKPPMHTGRARSESNIVTPPPEPMDGSHPSPIDLSQLDAKTLLLGDIGENSTWWTGRLDRKQTDQAAKRPKGGGAESRKRPISSKSPNINWAELESWYALIHSAGEDWQSRVARLKSDAPGFAKERLEGFANVDEIDDDIAEGREHAIRAVLKVTENLLKRPSRQLQEPEHIRFLLILLANPSLYPARRTSRRPASRAASNPQRTLSGKQNLPPPNNPSPRKSPGRESSQHTGILKRIFGLLANSPDVCHRYLIGWFARFDEEHLVRIIDLVGSFVTYRITRQQGRPHTKSMIADGGLIPDLSGSAMNTSQQLHAAMGLSGSVKKRADDPDQEPEYSSDWQVKAAAKLMSLLFTANNIWQGKRRSRHGDLGYPSGDATPTARAKRSGQLLHTSSFYNTLLDYMDIIADFKVWETKRDKFAFCQFPLFLSMGNKIKVLEYDARRQMEIRAREAYFDSVIRQRAQDGYFHLRVRRDCMVDDSLRQISEAVGAGQEELKKGLRVHFTGEEGVDAGGPRKEWFLMIVRDIFDPNHGMFVYDDESQTCYFNPNSFETSDQYHLVGALLGLAIYNSTILDVALPPFAFRKLLAAAPAAGAGNANISSLTGTKGQMTYTLSDLAEFRPSLASGLQQLLDFDGDVEEVYAWDFVAPVDRYGTVTNVPLKPNGEATPVTNANRQEFVDAYVRYLLDTAVARQFEPFKRGFFHVCAGNALSLFRAEEIELLIRGSDEALAVDQLKAVAVYENWKYPQPPHQQIQRAVEEVPVVQWFWELFSQAPPAMQRKLLTFITGTDRIPAVGATSLILRIVAGGDGHGGGGKEELARFPIARTCFNMLVLWRYETKEQLGQKLWRAVEESEGFGLK